MLAGPESRARRSYQLVRASGASCQPPRSLVSVRHRGRAGQSGESSKGRRERKDRIELLQGGGGAESGRCTGHNLRSFQCGAMLRLRNIALRGTYRTVRITPSVELVRTLAHPWDTYIPALSRERARWKSVLLDQQPSLLTLRRRAFRLCSNDSSVICRCPTPRIRARGPYGLSLLPPSCG